MCACARVCVCAYACVKITSLNSLRMKTRVIFDIFRYVIWTDMCVFYVFLSTCMLCSLSCYAPPSAKLLLKCTTVRLPGLLSQSCVSKKFKFLVL